MARRTSETSHGNPDLRDLQVRAAWHYYVEDLTQEQIADALGVSRAKVVRLLRGARDEGVVVIRASDPAGAQVALERALIERFALDDAIVTASSGRYDVAEVVGRAAARYLGEQVRDGMSIGIGWGETLDRCAQDLRASRLERVSVVSLLGGMTLSHSVNPSAVARRIADAWGADCYQLTAPLVVSKAATRAALWAEPGMTELRERARKADVAIVSVGDMSARATLFSEGLLPLALLDSLVDAGACGDVLGHFLDENGRPVDHPVRDRIVAVDLEDLRSVARVIIASGGERKVPALLAALRAVRTNVLITDELAARGLLSR